MPFIGVPRWGVGGGAYTQKFAWCREKSREDLKKASGGTPRSRGTKDYIRRKITCFQGILLGNIAEKGGLCLSTRAPTFPGPRRPRRLFPCGHAARMPAGPGAVRQHYRCTEGFPWCRENNREFSKKAGHDTGKPVLVGLFPTDVHRAGNLAGNFAKTIEGARCIAPPAIASLGKQQRNGAGVRSRGGDWSSQQLRQRCFAPPPSAVQGRKLNWRSSNLRYGLAEAFEAGADAGCVLGKADTQIEIVARSPRS